MYSKREVAELIHTTPKRARAAVLVAVLVTTLVGVYAHLASTSNAAGAAIDDRPGIANNPTIRPWSEYLSKEAADSGGIETNLDGNASALIASPLP